MVYQAAVVRVMIASPSDVTSEREVVREAIYEWNCVNSKAQGSVLLPVGWETHASPSLGGSAQRVINDEVLEDCDLLVGIFWTRIGTRTTVAASGTVEEIERHHAAGKPVMLYFSERAVPPSGIDTEQLEQVREFRGWAEKSGLIECFKDVDELRRKFARQLPVRIREDGYISQSISECMATALDEFGFAVSDGADQLTKEAKELLIAAAGNSEGMIYRIRDRAAEHIQVGGRAFNVPDDARSTARWNHALDQLINGGYVEAVSYEGQLFRVKELGYQLADRLGGAE